MRLTRALIDRLIIGEVWAFGPAENEEYWGKLVFMPFGRIFGYENANEYGWDFRSGALRMVRKDGDPTSLYEEITTTNGRPKMLGRSLLSPGSMYRLERLDHDNW